MRLIAQPATQHTDACTCVGWSLSGELFSCGDDSTVRKWNMNGEALAKVCELDTCYTTIAFLPTSNGGQKRGTAAEVFVIGCTDGTFRFINAFTGRVEKTQEAHQGAVVSLAWNWDGTALVTGGEEGLVKLWSQSGMLRATLADSKHCVHGISWGPNNDQVLFTCGKELIIKPLQSNAKQLLWKAHEGIVLTVDWNPITNLIVSGGEDGRYKVWDSYGRVLYASAPLDHPITSSRFSPDGEMFAVGSYNVLRICDKSGWSHCRQETSFARGNGRAEHGIPVDDVVETGSILNIAWTSDCTQLACGGGTGTVCFAQLVDRRVEYKNMLVQLSDTTKVFVKNVESEATEEIERPDKIIKMSIGYNHLILATSTQCCIYNLQNFQNPIFLDVKDKINLICQSERVFLTMDHFSGIQVFGYDGHHVSTLKGAPIRTEFLNYQSVSLSPDTVVLKDTHKQKEVQVFEALTGALNAHAQIQHPMEVVELALSQYGPQAERKLALVDRNRDLWLYSLRSKIAPVKLSTMVASVKWNDQSEVLVAIADGKLAIWYYPSVVFVDRDLLPRVRVVREDTQFGRHDQLLDFCASRCTVRRGADGACLTFAVRPYPIMLFGHTTKNDWNAAVRLCRFVKSDCLWSILAALSVKVGELATAEIAYAAINEADKLQYIKYIDEIGVPEARNAEVLLFQRRQDEAEKILLQANLIYRAIRMHIQLFNWDKALDLATKHRTHVDTVLWYRQKFLKNFGKVESDPRYLDKDILEVVVDPAAINAKREQEKEKERAMAQRR